MTQGPGLSREEKQKLALRCFQDKVLFCKTFLPHLFPKPIPWFHRGILAILTRDASWLPIYGELDKICEHFFHEDGDGIIHRVFQLLPDGTVRMDLGKFTLLMVPRGYSKTTIAGIAVPLSDILYKVTPFTVYVSEGGKHVRGRQARGNAAGQRQAGTHRQPQDQGCLWGPPAETQGP